MHRQQLTHIILLALGSTTLISPGSAQLCPPSSAYYVASLRFTQKSFTTWPDTEPLEIRETSIYASKLLSAAQGQDDGGGAALDARDAEQWYGSTAKAEYRDRLPVPQWDEWTDVPSFSSNRSREDQGRRPPPRLQLKLSFPRLPYAPRSKEPGDGLPPRFVAGDFSLRGVEGQPDGSR